MLLLRSMPHLSRSTLIKQVTMYATPLSAQITTTKIAGAASFRYAPRRSLQTTSYRLQERQQQQLNTSSTKLNESLKHVTQQASDATGGFARRSMLYVPGSSDKMIKKSQSSTADCLIFDLEDSVASHKKGAARESVLHGLHASPRSGPELAVRINPPSSARSLANDDLDVVLPCLPLNTIVVPKVEATDDLLFILDKVELHRAAPDFPMLTLVLSVESANSLLKMASIVEQFAVETQKRDLSQCVRIGALLFASEDYCATTGIIRSRTRKELLFPRAHMATTAKAYGLQAIDMVCIDYNDMAYLEDESAEGRALGYDGKQAIHPNQVDTIQKTFSPSEKDIERAAKIKEAYEQSLQQDKGAVGFAEGDSIIMVDAPLLKQADIVLAKARAAGLHIPDVSAEQ